MSTVVTLMAVGFCSSSAVFAATIVVDSSVEFVSTGILSTGNESYNIVSSGTVDLAPADGGYSVNPNGFIVTAPIFGSNSYNYFLNEVTSGVAPDAGVQKFAGNFAYGALLYGFSASAAPASLADFPLGLFYLGSNASINAPVGGGYLYLSVHDINRQNAGSYSSDITTSISLDVQGTPEPSTFLLLGSALVLALHRLRKQPRLGA